MGEHLVDALAVGDAHHLQKVDGALLDLLLALALAVVEGDDLVDLLTDAEDRVEGGHGLLEDHGDVVAPELLHDLVGGLGDIIGLVAQVQADGALHHLALGPLQQLHQGEAGDALAAAGLAHDAHGLADGHVEGDAVHGLGNAHVGEEVGLQAVKLHGVVGVVHLGEILGLGDILALALFLQGIGDLAVLLGDPAGFFRGQIAVVLFCHFGILPSQRFILGSKASRRPSPTRLKARTVSSSSTPAGIQMNQ